jgi:hypothetical protein
MRRGSAEATGAAARTDPHGLRSSSGRRPRRTCEIRRSRTTVWRSANAASCSIWLLKMNQGRSRARLLAVGPRLRTPYRSRVRCWHAGSLTDLWLGELFVRRRRTSLDDQNFRRHEATTFAHTRRQSQQSRPLIAGRFSYVRCQARRAIKRRSPILANAVHISQLDLCHQAARNFRFPSPSCRALRISLLCFLLPASLPARSGSCS